jgi:hypothetical protein
MPIDILSLDEVEPLVARVKRAADLAVRRARDLLAAETDSLVILRQFKFAQLGRHPLDDMDLNLIEQVNQTWTFLVTLRALPFLFGRHPDAEGFRLYLGTEGGTDIVSIKPDVVAAEAFAAVRPRNNQKLKKDIDKLARECPNARARYVFFNAPGFKHERQFSLEMVTAPGIEVWGIDV